MTSQLACLSLEGGESWSNFRIRAALRQPGWNHVCSTHATSMSSRNLRTIPTLCVCERSHFFATFEVSSLCRFLIFFKYLKVLLFAQFVHKMKEFYSCRFNEFLCVHFVRNAGDGELERSFTRTHRLWFHLGDFSRNLDTDCGVGFPPTLSNWLLHYAFLLSIFIKIIQLCRWFSITLELMIIIVMLFPLHQ